MSELTPNLQNERVLSGGEVRFDLHKESEHVMPLNEGQALAAARLAAEKSQQTIEKAPTDSEIIAIHGLYVLQVRRHTAVATQADFDLAAGV